MFEYNNEEDYKLQINPNSAIDPDAPLFFKFVGRVFNHSNRFLLVVLHIIVTTGAWPGYSQSSSSRLLLHTRLPQAHSQLTHGSEVRYV